MRKVGTKSLPVWAVIVIIVVFAVALTAYFEVRYGFLFGEDGIFAHVASGGEPLKEFSSAVFESAEMRADGREHTLRVTHIPLGATVTYDIGNTFSEAGVYTVTATISMEGYKTKTMTATLTLYKAYVITFRQFRGQREFEVKEGETFDLNLVPEIEPVEGYTAKWEDFDPKLTSNVVVDAIYTKIAD